MNRCSKCKSELPTEARYCNVCGTPQIKTASSPSSSEPSSGLSKETTEASNGEAFASQKPEAGPPATRTVRPTIKYTSQRRNAEEILSSLAHPAQTITPPATPEPSTPSGMQKSPVPAKPATQKPTPAFKTLIWPETARKTTPGLPETPRPLTEADPYKHPSQPGSLKSSVQTGMHSSSNSTKQSDKLEQEPNVKKDKIPARPGAKTSTSSPRPALIRPVGPPTLPKRPINPKPAGPSQAERIQPAQPEQAPVVPSHLTRLDKFGHDQSGRQGLKKEPAAFAEQLQSENAQVIEHEQVIDKPTLPNSRIFSVENLPIEEITTGQLAKSNGHDQYDSISAQATLENILLAISPESMAVTSKETEHWRRSWRERQEADPEPVAQVSRGQASVPSPLLSMRAITTNKQNADEQSPGFSFWVTLFLMLCLIGGLGVYIVSTYLPNTSLGVVHSTSQGTTFSPTLSISGPQTATFKRSQKLQLHGEHFAAHDPITFLLDTTTPIMNTGGRALSTSTTDAGTFDVVLLIGADWTVGAHVISAEDTRTNISAYLNIQVDPTGTAKATSSDLTLYLNGQHLQQLTFSAVFGQENPPQQRITLMNTSGAALQWTAVAVATQNLSWLVIDDNHTSGTLNIDGTDTIGISTLLTGLKSSNTPYKGQIVFTINGKEQLTLPVELQLEASSAEMAFSPNPIIAYEGAGGTCKPGTTLTLINLGTVVITWAVHPDENISSNIQFLLNGQLTEEGQLLPSGSEGDTTVLTLKCAGVQVGERYHVTVYGNKAHWDAFVVIQS